MTAVDTNILIYIHDPRDLVKQAKAATLVQSLSDGVLLWQVACEYLAASRKLEPLGYSRAQAWQDVQDLRLLWTTILPSWNVMDRAEQLLTRYSLSFWDSMVVAVCLDGGVQLLYSEDFDAYSQIDSLQLANPF